MKKIVFIIMLLFPLSVICQESKTGYNETYWKAEVLDGSGLLLQMNIKDNKFSFTSRKGSSKEIIGNKYLLARLLGKAKPTAVKISGTCYYKEDTLILKGKYVSLTSKQDFNGKVYGDSLRAVMTNNSIIGNRIEAPAPIRNYPMLADKIIEVTEQNLFNPLFPLSPLSPSSPSLYSFPKKIQPPHSA